MEIRKVGILWNPSKTAGLKPTQILMELMEAHGIDVCTQATLNAALGLDRVDTRDFSECQLLFVVGGDGTLLSALDYSLPNDIPLVGINLGRMGFLAEIEPNVLREDVEKILDGKYHTENRMLICAEGFDSLRYFALNEIIITRINTSVRMIAVEIEADGVLVDRISGDGVIIATATGSTAYSLSAGGPIISPNLECFVITPICPHTMNARPVVLSSTSRITVRILGGSEGGQAVFDGKRSLPLASGGNGITLIRAQRQASFVRLHDRNYFGLLRGKLSEWTH